MDEFVVEAFTVVDTPGDEYETDSEDDIGGKFYCCKIETANTGLVSSTLKRDSGMLEFIYCH